jgi:hypothetical protein
MKPHVMLVCVLLGATVSCEQAPTTPAVNPATLMTENAERAKLGLRQVGTNWFLYSVEFGEEKWKITPDGYEAKKICRDTENRILWEADSYYSGKTFVVPNDPGIDSTGWEFISVVYDYRLRELTVSYVGKDPAVRGLFPPLSGDIVTNNVSVADTILKMWGMSRL